ncbi:MAG TPA: ROK family protein [Bryobacteraceae bacterium]|nr:ROK family protein [Bryobacteraceae bacterium]
MSRVLAVDLGGTKHASALVDEAGGVTEKRKLPADRSLEGTVSQIADRASGSGIDRVGIIVPGIYDPRNGTAWAPNLWGWDPVPLRAALERRLSVPATIASDRAGYVLGEQWLGAARGLQDVAFVAVGTGIGVGILSGGRLIEGAHGIAGAAGWMAVDRAWKPEYERTGCWEWEAAGPAVARRAGLDSAQAVVEAACKGDERAMAALEETASFLAMGIANLISILDPDAVILGGGLMQAGDVLLERIRAHVPRWAQPIAARLTRIELTALGEDAGLFGAARLAFLSGEGSAGIS